MKKLDRDRVTCRVCGKAKLRPVKDGDKVLTYICIPGCGRGFDPLYHRDFEHGRVLLILREKNPAFRAEIGKHAWTAEGLEQLLRDETTSEPYLSAFIVGWMDIENGEWYEGPPPAS